MSAVTQADQDDLHLMLDSYLQVNRKQRDTLDKLFKAVQVLHAAKGRYHTQIAICELFELCGLPAERPKK